MPRRWPIRRRPPPAPMGMRLEQRSMAGERLVACWRRPQTSVAIALESASAPLGRSDPHGTTEHAGTVAGGPTGSAATSGARCVVKR